MTTAGQGSTPAGRGGRLRTGHGPLGLRRALKEVPGPVDIRGANGQVTAVEEQMLAARAGAAGAG
ncbi:MAG TPA: hypothetical protein VMB82_13100, partial [Acidimicrobiales bacterium]|nr:hypothetical protein [Acidimicrobiales bacterium]